MSIAHPRRTATLAILLVGAVVAAGAFYHEPSGAAPNPVKGPRAPAVPERRVQQATEQPDDQEQQQLIDIKRRELAADLEFERKREALRAQQDALLNEQRKSQAPDPYALPFVSPHPEGQATAAPAGQIAAPTPSATRP